MLLLIFFLLSARRAVGNSNGAPAAACGLSAPAYLSAFPTMCANAPATTTAFNLSLPSSYTGGAAAVPISLSGSTTFKGFYLSASHGSFAAPSSGPLKLLTCTAPLVAITHANADDKATSAFASVTWSPPAAGTGAVSFVWVVLASRAGTACVYEARSVVVAEAVAATTPAPPAPVPPTAFSVASAPLAPANVSQPAAGSQWSTPVAANVAADDALFINISLGASAKAAAISFFNFGLPALPSSVSVVGVTATVTRSGVGQIVDDDVYLVNNNNRLAGNQNLASPTPWPSGGESLPFGSATTTWGVTLTEAIVTRAQFGFAIAAGNRDNDSVATASIGAVSMRLQLRFSASLTAVVPASAPTNAGGDSVLLRGTGFLPSNAQHGVGIVVQFGSAAASVVSVNGTEMNVTAPAGPESQSVSVRVSFDNGTTFTAPIMFAYGAAVPVTTTGGAPTSTPPSTAPVVTPAPTAPVTTRPPGTTNATLPAIPAARGVDYHLYHSVLMLLAWWVLTTASTFLARFLKDVGDYWSMLHLVLSVLVVLLTIAGFALAVVGVNGGELIASDPHHYLGYALMFLVLVQPGIGFFARHRHDPMRERVPVWPDGVHNVFGYVLWLGFVVQTFLGVLRRSASPFGDNDPIPQLLALALVVVFVVAVFIVATILVGRSVIDATRTQAAEANAKATGSAPQRPRGLLCALMAAAVAVALLGTAGVVATLSLDVSPGVPPWAICGAVVGVCAIALGLLIFFAYKRRKAEREAELLGTAGGAGTTAPSLYGSQPQAQQAPPQGMPSLYAPAGSDPMGYSQPVAVASQRDFVPSYSNGATGEPQQLMPAYSMGPNAGIQLQPVGFGPQSGSGTDFANYNSAVHEPLAHDVPTPPSGLTPAYSQRPPQGLYDAPQSSFGASLRPSQPQFQSAFQPVISTPPGLPPPIAPGVPSMVANPMPPPPPPMPGMGVPPPRPMGGLPPPIAALPPPLPGVFGGAGNAVDIDWNVSEDSE